jgi:hypothetical protein
MYFHLKNISFGYHGIKVIFVTLRFGIIRIVQIHHKSRANMQVMHSSDNFFIITTTLFLSLFVFPSTVECGVIYFYDFENEKFRNHSYNLLPNYLGKGSERRKSLHQKSKKEHRKSKN